MIGPLANTLGPLGTAAGGPTGPVTLLKDSFTDANGTLLTAHTMDVGPGWTSESGAVVQIEGNAAQQVTAGGETVYGSDSGQANVTVSGVSVNSNPGTGAGDGGVIARLSDANNFWVLMVQYDPGAPGGQGLGLWSRIAGTFTQVAFSAFVPVANTSYSLSLVCNGTTISGTVNGAHQVSTTSTFNQSATICGLLFDGGFVTNSLDNFLVTSL